VTDRRTDNLGYWCHEAARAHASRIALVDLSRAQPREVSYRELEERLDRFAAMVAAAGLRPGDRMAMAIGNRFEFVEVMFGAMRAGVVPVPMNTKLGADTLAYVLADSGAIAAVVDPASNPRIVAACDAAPLRAKFALDGALPGWRDYESSLQASPAAFEPPALAPDHMSFLPYTSGSTGKPKGVVLTHAGQLWWIRTLQKHWPSGPGDRALAMRSLCCRRSVKTAGTPPATVHR